METIIDEKVLLSFTIGEEMFAIDVANAVQVIDMQKITQVPHAPANILGIINYRGNVLPVMDIRKKLKLKEHKAVGRQVLLILSVPIANAHQLLGIIVNKVYDVFSVAENSIEQVPEIAKLYNTGILQGMVKVRENHIMIFNPENILTKTELKK
jgi:purine-binding chemotaxis protein CheW